MQRKAFIVMATVNAFLVGVLLSQGRVNVLSAAHFALAAWCAYWAAVLSEVTHDGR